MNKIHIGILFGIFALASFVALNLYTSTSEPGFGQNEACNNCHNQPALVKDVSASFAMNNYTQAAAAFTNTTWSSDEIPTIQTNNRTNIQFDFVAFQKNSTSLMVMAQVADNTPTTKGQGSATSDKFGVLFNIDVANFTVGQFLVNNNGKYVTGQPLGTTLTGGDMSFPQGHADFWYIDLNNLGYNATGMAQDEAISTGILSDGAAHQDVHVAVWYITVYHGPTAVHEYVYFFVRNLNTNDPNDAQFNVAGTAIHYAIAGWNDTSTFYHLSSFDQMIIVGNKFNVINNVTATATATVTETKTVSGSSSVTSTASAFTMLFVLAGLFVSIPLISKYRNRKQ